MDWYLSGFASISSNSGRNRKYPNFLWTRCKTNKLDEYTDCKWLLSKTYHVVLYLEGKYYGV